MPASRINTVLVSTLKVLKVNIKNIIFIILCIVYIHNVIHNTYFIFISEKAPLVFSEICKPSFCGRLQALRGKFLPLVVFSDFEIITINFK